MKKVLLALILSVLPSFCCHGQRVEGSASANLKGRTVVGILPKPSYGINVEGTVIVQIEVDWYGNVTKAIPGVEGTTITNKELWDAAQNAAMKTHFSFNVDAPTAQTGTITYICKPTFYSIQELVEDLAQWDFCTIKGVYVETLNSSNLIFLVENEDYIIPVKLVNDDLGAVHRFRAMNLHKGDSLTISGNMQEKFYVTGKGYYKGLENAVILDRKPGPAASNKTSGRVTPIERSETATDGEMSVIGEEQFRQFDERPLFKGGDANMFSMWVNSPLVYPEKAKENGIQGRVILQFTIKADGRVTDVKVLRGIDKYLDKEAVRVVSSSPKWTPGKSAGKPVDVTMTFPVIFQLR